MNDTKRFKKLFEPITVNGMRIKNRFVMAPMLGGSDTSGFATDRMVGWYEESAKGGVGLIILGAHCVDSKLGRLMPIQPNIDDDKYIPALSKVAKGIQKHGVKAAIQIHHSGPAVLSFMMDEQPVGASAIQRHG
jgi:2,4-dienoyl-CoA reductase-like NADH-dependent reductase (Old Yellow Enzyme family)